MKCIRIVDSRFNEGDSLTIEFGEGAFRRKATVPVQTYALVPDAFVDELEGNYGFVCYPMSYAVESVVPLLDGEEGRPLPPPPRPLEPHEIPSPAHVSGYDNEDTGEFPAMGDEPTGPQVVVETKVLPGKPKKK